ncbi:MAG: GNAT family N-acetyltransferase [Oscillospiraceae bacterium]|nr:hypothetical protein [Bacillota bacterium]
MTEKEQALAYLGKDPVLNISMIEPLRLGRARVAAQSGQGVALEMDGIAMVAAENLGEALSLLETLPEVQTWNVMAGALSDAVAAALGLKEESRCYQAAYFRKEPLPVRADVRPLDMSYFQAVLDGYSLFHNPEYVEDRLKAGVIFGAFVDGRLAGFVGEHHEGSMGMLEVFPPYRGHGLGLALESFQINRYLSQGRVPFDQVIVGNEKSMSLQKKVGMELSKDTMSWLHRK